MSGRAKLCLFANAPNRMEFLNEDREAPAGPKGDDQANQKPTYKKLAVVSVAFFGLLVTAKAAANAIKEYRVCCRFCFMFSTHAFV